jgi:hypothetical protein
MEARVKLCKFFDHTTDLEEIMQRPLVFNAGTIDSTSFEGGQIAV